jgi:hypothetical protein
MIVLLDRLDDADELAQELATVERAHVVPEVRDARVHLDVGRVDDALQLERCEHAVRHAPGLLDLLGRGDQHDAAEVRVVLHVRREGAARRTTPPRRPVAAWSRSSDYRRVRPQRPAAPAAESRSCCSMLRRRSDAFGTLRDPYNRTPVTAKGPTTRPRATKATRAKVSMAAETRRAAPKDGPHVRLEADDAVCCALPQGRA